MLQPKFIFYRNYKNIRKKLEEIRSDAELNPDIYDIKSTEYIERLIKAKKDSKTFFGIRYFPISIAKMKEIKEFIKNFKQEEYIIETQYI